MRSDVILDNHVGLAPQAGDLGVYWLEYDAPPTGALLWLPAETMWDDA